MDSDRGRGGEKDQGAVGGSRPSGGTGRGSGPSILDRARPYVRRVRPRALRLVAAVVVFAAALVFDTRRTLSE